MPNPLAQKISQMPFMERNHIAQAFSANSSYQPLAICVSGGTMASAERQSLQTRDNRLTKILSEARKLATP